MAQQAVNRTCYKSRSDQYPLSIDWPEADDIVSFIFVFIQCVVHVEQFNGIVNYAGRLECVHALALHSTSSMRINAKEGKERREA